MAVASAAELEGKCGRRSEDDLVQPALSFVEEPSWFFRSVFMKAWKRCI